MLWPPGRPVAALPEVSTTKGEAEGDGLGPAWLYAALADGMGGHTAGALASKMVCEAFISTAKTGEPTDDRLVGGLEAANTAIAEIVAARPELSGMGSTLVASSFTSEGMSWVSVGDSPLYLWRRGEIALLNEDHSLAPALDQLAREGKITEAQARQDPRRHMLRSAITGEDLELVDVSRKPLQIEDGDYFILASDGIHTLEQDEIARVVTAFAPDGAVAVAEALIRAVSDMRAPHQDNTTVIAVRPID
ncbi:MAG: hypothetical protein RLZ98_318 [Pseudomonadota bacterium]|jgi:protein phosphatase